jgi:hypothetical protein
MKENAAIAVMGALAALLAASLAFAQTDRLLPPVDQFGPVVGPVGPLQMPGDPGPNWTLDERARIFDLVTAGTLTATSPTELRLQREGEPDAILLVRPETSFFLGGESVTRDLLPLGSEVRAVFDLEGNRRIARRVEATPPGEEAGAAPGAAVPPPVSSEIPGAAIEAPPRSAE